MPRGAWTDEHRKKMQEARKKMVGRSLVLAMLDSKTLLTATEYAFVIKEKELQKKDDGTTSEHWVSRYYYSELGDAVRGYIKHRLRKPIELEKMDGSLKALLDKLAEMESVTKKICGDLSAFWNDKVKNSHYAQMISKGAIPVGMSSSELIQEEISDE